MEWPATAPDLDHIEQLKKADPFFKELRSQGFTSMVLAVGPRVVWSKDL